MAKESGGATQIIARKPHDALLIGSHGLQDTFQHPPYSDAGPRTDWFTLELRIFNCRQFLRRETYIQFKMTQ